MADKKISALTGATTPLAGTEVLPIVQGGSTVKVSIADVTAGRAPSMSGATLRNTAPVLNFVTTAGEDITGYISNAIDVGSGGKLIFGTKRNGDTPLDRVSINAAGDMSLLTSNLVIGTAGKGIDFSANTHAAGMTSELLNDYEEGTWTPTDASGAGLSLTVTAATYTKIGRMVYASLNITYPATANGSTLLVGGLPFVSKNAGSVTIAYTNQGTAISGSTSPADDTFFALYKYDGTILVNSDMSGKILRATVIYQSA
jgi:hypothetical protein